LFPRCFISRIISLHCVCHLLLWFTSMQIKWFCFSKLIFNSNCRFLFSKFEVSFFSKFSKCANMATLKKQNNFEKQKIKMWFTVYLLDFCWKTKDIMVLVWIFMLYKLSNSVFVLYVPIVLFWYMIFTKVEISNFQSALIWQL